LGGGGKVRPAAVSRVPRLGEGREERLGLVMAVIPCWKGRMDCSDCFQGYEYIYIYRLGLDLSTHLAQ
jgi:hypothetical protein